MENILAERKLDPIQNWKRYAQHHDVGRYVDDKVENQMMVVCITLDYINRSVALST